MVLGQGLGISDVEAGAPDEPLVEGGEQVLAVDDLAARHVDEDGMPPHAPEQVAREQVARGLGQRQPDHDGVREAEHLVEPVGLPDVGDAGLGWDVLDVDGDHAHAEGEGAARDLAARPPEAHDAHRGLEQLALLDADGLAQAVVGPADRGVNTSCQAEEERHGVLGEVDAHAALLARERDVALHELGAEDGVDTGADRVVEAQPPVQHEDVGGDAAEQHVGVDNLRALPRGLLDLDEDSAGPGGLEDARALLGVERGHDHERRVQDLHARVTSVTSCPSTWSVPSSRFHSLSMWRICPGASESWKAVRLWAICRLFRYWSCPASIRNSTRSSGASTISARAASASAATASSGSPASLCPLAT